MANGFFLGGMAQGMSDAAKQTLAEQTQANVEKQQTVVNVQKQISDTMNVVSEISKAAADAGKDPQSVAKVIQPLVDSAASLAQRAYGPEGAARIQQMGSALLARPASAPDTKYSSHVITDPNNPLQQNIVSVDTKTGIPKMYGPTGQPMTGAPTVAPSPNVNLTAPGTSITGVDVQDVTAQKPQLAQGASVPPSTTVPAPPTVPVAGYTADTIDFRARQLLSGNTDATKNLPRSKVGMAVKAAIENRATALAKEQGMTPDEANSKIQEFKAKTAGAQVLGKREATLAGAIANVTATAPIVADLSSKIDRTKFPLINSIVIAGKEQTGDPTVVRLGIALNTVTTAYARAQGGGNNVLTDSAREEAKHLLQIAYSDGQLKAGVDQLLIEMQRENSKVGDALNDYLKLHKQNIEQQAAPPVNNFITPGGTKFRILQ